MADDTTASLGIEVHTKGAKEASQDLDKLTTSAKGAAQASKDLGAATRATGSGASAASNAINSVSNAAKGATSAHSEATAATHAFRDAMHSLNPVLYSAGAQLGNVGMFIGAAKAGIVGLGIALTGGALVAVEKFGDAIKTVKDRLDVLKGSDAASAFNSIKKAADDSKASILATASSIERLRQLTISERPGFTAPPQGQDRAAAEAIATISQGLQLGGKSASEAATSINAYIDALAKLDPVSKKSLGLTKELFDSILHDSPQLAQAIAQAAGAFANNERDLLNFSESLAKQPKSLQQFLDILRRIQPEVQKAFQAAPPNLSQSLDRVTTSLGNIMRSMGESGGFAAQFADNFATGLQAIANGQFGAAVVDIFRTVFNNVITAVGEIFSNIAKSFHLDEIRSAMESAFSGAVGVVQNLFAQLPASAQSAISSIGQIISQIVQSVVSGVMSMVQSALSALAQLMQAKASANMNAGVIPGGEGMPVMNGGGPSFNINSAEFTAGFATGGSFTVGGDGGTDTTPVRFMATKGEVVTITPSNLSPPNGMVGAAAASINNTIGGATDFGQTAAPASAITNPITSSVVSSSDKIVTAINGVASSIAAASIGGGGVGSASRGAPFMPFGKAGTPGAPIGSGPIDAYGNIVPPTQYSYIGRINYNSAIAGLPQGPGQPVYFVNPQYTGAFATGGSFTVGGSGGPDSQRISMDVTPGEQVSIYPPGRTGMAGKTDASDWAKQIEKSMMAALSQFLPRSGGRRIGKERPIQIILPNAAAPQSFIAAEAQIRRAMRRAF